MDLRRRWWFVSTGACVNPGDVMSIGALSPAFTCYILDPETLVLKPLVCVVFGLWLTTLLMTVHNLWLNGPFGERCSFQGGILAGCRVRFGVWSELEPMEQDSPVINSGIFASTFPSKFSHGY